MVLPSLLHSPKNEDLRIRGGPRSRLSYPDFLSVEVEAAKRVGIRFGYRGYTSIQADAFTGAWKRLFDVDFRVMFSKDLPLAYVFRKTDKVQPNLGTQDIKMIRTRNFENDWQMESDRRVV